jgi:hypothetical protein
MNVRWLALAALCALYGCKLEASHAGDSCKRSTQCDPGLVCVRGKCSKDLKPIASESSVPDLGVGMGEGAMAAGAGGAAAGTPAAGGGGASGSQM